MNRQVFVVLALALFCFNLQSFNPRVSPLWIALEKGYFWVGEQLRIPAKTMRE